MINYEDIKQAATLYGRQTTGYLPIDSEEHKSAETHFISGANYVLNELKDSVKKGLPCDCVDGWDEIKFCSRRNSDGWACKQCAI